MFKIKSVGFSNQKDNEFFLDRAFQFEAFGETFSAMFYFYSRNQIYLHEKLRKRITSRCTYDFTQHTRQKFHCDTKASYLFLIVHSHTDTHCRYEQKGNQEKRVKKREKKKPKGYCSPSKYRFLQRYVRGLYLPRGNKYSRGPPNEVLA